MTNPQLALRASAIAFAAAHKSRTADLRRRFVREVLDAAKEMAGMGKDDKAELLVLPDTNDIFDQFHGGSSADSHLQQRLATVARSATKLHGDVETLRKRFA